MKLNTAGLASRRAITWSSKFLGISFFPSGTSFSNSKRKIHGKGRAVTVVKIVEILQVQLSKVGLSDLRVA